MYDIGTASRQCGTGCLPSLAILQIQRSCARRASETSAAQRAPTFSNIEVLAQMPWQLSDDKAYYHKSIPLRHPLIFYFGHTATFFINKLILAGLVDKRINPRFESMFAIGVDEMSWDDLNDAHYDWPSVQQVKEYGLKI